MTIQNFEIIERLPSASEHKFLWEAVGWGNIDIEVSERSLSNTLYSVVVAKDSDIIGMGRIVGDGVMYFYIQDVAVLPAFQGEGVGRMIIDQLMSYIRKCRPANGVVYAGLFAMEGKTEFYEKFGFKDQSPKLTGMYITIDQ